MPTDGRHKTFQEKKMQGQDIALKEFSETVQLAFGISAAITATGGLVMMFKLASMFPEAAPVIKFAGAYLSTLLGIANLTLSHSTGETLKDHLNDARQRLMPDRLAALIPSACALF